MRILYFIYGLNIGGAETFVYNVLSSLDMKIYHIDFVLQTKDNANIKLLELCKKKKCTIKYVSAFNKNILRHIKDLDNVLKNGNYNVIHIHANALINITPVMIALHRNVPVVLHSHNTSNNQGGAVGRLLHFINRKIVIKKNIVRLACGEEAGKWMYGKTPFQVINNAINLDEYKFNPNYRKAIREKFNLSNEFVVGHIGRFVTAKNHEFIIECFAELKKKKNNFKLMLVGDGELHGHIVAKCRELDLVNDVIFVGEVQNTKEYYSAFDCMLFPSLFEGLPFTLVEAQAAGLLVYASDNISKDVAVTDRVLFLPLNITPKGWTNYIGEKIVTEDDRLHSAEAMSGSIYDMKRILKKITSTYDKIYSNKI